MVLLRRCVSAIVSEIQQHLKLPLRLELPSSPPWGELGPRGARGLPVLPADWGRLYWAVSDPGPKAEAAGCAAAALGWKGGAAAGGASSWGCLHIQLITHLCVSLLAPCVLRHLLQAWRCCWCCCTLKVCSRPDALKLLKTVVHVAQSLLSYETNHPGWQYAVRLHLVSCHCVCHQAQPSAARLGVDLDEKAASDPCWPTSAGAGVTPPDAHCCRLGTRGTLPPSCAQSNLGDA